jgi:hypothetical protein
MLSAEVSRGDCVTRSASGAIGVNPFVPQPRKGTAEQFRAFAAALSLEAGSASFGKPCHDDDDWRQA